MQRHREIGSGQGTHQEERVTHRIVAPYFRLYARVEDHLDRGAELRNPSRDKIYLLAASLSARWSADLRTGCGDFLIRFEPLLGAVSAVLRLRDRHYEVRHGAMNTLRSTYPSIAEPWLKTVVEKETNFHTALSALRSMKARGFASADEAGEILKQRTELEGHNQADIQTVLTHRYQIIMPEQDLERRVVVLNDQQAKLVACAEKIFDTPERRQQGKLLKALEKQHSILAKGLSLALDFTERRARQVSRRLKNKR
jgi:hypothetical protein